MKTKDVQFTNLNRFFKNILHTFLTLLKRLFSFRMNIIQCVYAYLF